MGETEFFFMRNWEGTGLNNKTSQQLSLEETRTPALTYLTAFCSLILQMKSPVFWQQRLAVPLEYELVLVAENHLWFTRTCMEIYLQNENENSTMQCNNSNSNSNSDGNRDSNSEWQ